MKLSFKLNQKNPFRLSFFSIAIICCITFSIIAFYVGYINTKTVRQEHNLAKTQQLMQDWEAQLQLINETAVRIASNYEFHPRYFQSDVTKEVSLLTNLRQYHYYLPLTEAYFLYYGGDYIYLSRGSTLNMDLFLNTTIPDATEREKLRAELTAIGEGVSEGTKGTKTLSIDGDIYVFFSFRVSEEKGHSYALSGFILDAESLAQRFQTVASGISGKLSLYQGDVLLFSNQETSCTPEQKGVLTALSSDRLYALCYMPDKESGFRNGLLPLFLLLVALDLIFVLFISNRFANRAYEPILSMSSKYKKLTFNDEVRHDNALEEIDHMMDAILQSNLKASLQLQKKQKQLKDQLLRLLLEGKYSMDLEANLEQIEIHLPGPYFFVLGIPYEEADITEEVLANLQQELEQISEPAESTYVYTVSNRTQKQIYVICSIETDDMKEDLCETVCSVAESFCAESFIGVGSAYRSLSKLSASWLESRDDIHFRQKQAKAQSSQDFGCEARELHRIVTALEIGSESAALEALDGYVRQLKQPHLSMLMQQYGFTTFVGEIATLGRKLQLEMSRQNISMLVSSRNVNDFEVSAKKIIHDFCESFASLKTQNMEAALSEVYAYINAHYTEYDMSLEKTADALHVSTGVVRKAVSVYTGKTYKDYLIQLRIEHAKRLLRTEDLPIAEICSKVGYGSTSYFIKLFREITGVTPAKYKLRCVEESAET